MKYYPLLIILGLMISATLVTNFIDNLNAAERFAKVGLLTPAHAARMKTDFSDWKFLDVNRKEFVDRLVKDAYPGFVFELESANDIGNWYRYSLMNTNTYIYQEMITYGTFRWYYIGKNPDYKKYRRHE